MDTNTLIILVLSVISLFLSLSVLRKNNRDNKEQKRGKKREHFSSTLTDCDPSCVGNPNLNPLILTALPNPINIPIDMPNSNINGILSITYSNFDSYIYVKKGCQVEPITLVLSTYASLNISGDSLINSLIPIPTGLTQITISNIFLSLEVFIDCNTLQLSIKNIFVDISDGEGGNPKTEVNTGSSYDNLINAIISNNSQSINFQKPSCSFDLTTCNLSPNCNSMTDPSCCRSLVKTINSFISQNVSNLPSFDLPPSSPASFIIKNICGK